MARAQEKKKKKSKGSKSKQKTTLESTNATTGSLKKRNQITYDLNASSVVARSKLCKEMDEKPKKHQA
jgi:ribosomal protein S25